MKYSLWECRPPTIEEFINKAIFLVAVKRKRIANGSGKMGNSMDGLVPTSRFAKPAQYMGDPMEIDHLQPTEEGEEENDCECMALHEHGFQGPCYFCQRKGHMLRNCPRKAAGLPKIYSNGPSGNLNGQQGRTSFNRGNAKPEAGGNRPRTGYGERKPQFQRRINSLDLQTEDLPRKLRLKPPRKPKTG